MTWDNHNHSSCKHKFREIYLHMKFSLHIRHSISITENTSSISHSPREDKIILKCVIRKNIMLHIGHQNWDNYRLPATGSFISLFPLLKLPHIDNSLAYMLFISHLPGHTAQTTHTSSTSCILTCAGKWLRKFSKLYPGSIIW